MSEEISETEETSDHHNAAASAGSLPFSEGEGVEKMA